MNFYCVLILEPEEYIFSLLLAKYTKRFTKHFLLQYSEARAKIIFPIGHGPLEFKIQEIFIEIICS